MINDLEEWKKEARELYGTLKLDELIKKCEERLKEDPNCEFSHFWWGRALLTKDPENNIGKAREHFEKAKNISLTQVVWGEAMGRKQDYDKGKKLALQAINDKKAGYEDYLALGFIYSNEKDYEKSSFYYAEALNIHKSADLYYLCGKASLNIKNAAKAIDYLTDALKLDEKNPQYWYMSACAYYQLGDYKQAEVQCEQAIELDMQEKFLDLLKDINKKIGLKCFEVGDFENLKNKRTYENTIENTLFFYNSGEHNVEVLKGYFEKNKRMKKN